MIRPALGLALLLAALLVSALAFAGPKRLLQNGVPSSGLPTSGARPAKRLAATERDAIYDALSAEPRITPTVRVVEAVGPSVVHIETETTQRVRQFPMGTRDVIARGGGTGVVVHEDGFIVTNYHVVKGAKKIQVSFHDDLTPYSAELLSYKESEDLALLRLKLSDEKVRAHLTLAGASTNDGKVQFPAVRMGQSRDLMTGELVIAIGNPHGQAHTVSTGIVSGQHRQVQVENLLFRDLIQTDASINLGNSGGPLLNVRGELIGINTVMNLQAENIGFAIPVDRVREVLAEELFPNARTSWLGLELAPGDGLQVTRVWAGGPADLAGICEGDELATLAGAPLDDRQAFLDASLELHPNVPAEFTVKRSDREERARLLPWDRLDGILYEHVGLLAREQTLGQNTFLVIETIAADGPADQLGLRKGDLLPAVRPYAAGVLGPLRIHDRRDLAGVIESLAVGTRISVDVYRDLNENGDYDRNELLKGDFITR